MATDDTEDEKDDGVGKNFDALISKLQAQYHADVGRLRAQIASLPVATLPFEAIVSINTGKSIEEVEPNGYHQVDNQKPLPSMAATSELLRVNPNRLDASKNGHYNGNGNEDAIARPFSAIVCNQVDTTEPTQKPLQKSTSALGDMFRSASSDVFRSGSSELQDLGRNSTQSFMSAASGSPDLSKGLSTNAGGGFRLHSDWMATRHTQLSEGVDDHHVEAETRKLLKRVGTSGAMRNVSKRVTSKEFDGVRGKFVIDPGSDVRMAWDVAGMVLIAWDLITVPFLAFDPEENIVTTLMEWVTLLFWTADMGWSVFTGFFREGRLVTSHKAILLHYLRTWFAIDLLVVGPDWVMTIMGSSSNVGKLGRLLKAARVIRVLRLLRLLKLRRLVNELYDRIASELMFIIVELIKLLTFILVLNHLVACSWYLVGYIGKITGARKNWLEDVGMTPAWGEDLAWRYFTSLHWSITQFTPASMDISATNTGERIFSIFILFFALVALSSVISSVSSAMTVIRNMSGDRQKQFWMLRRYLTQRKVTKELSGRIVKYLEHRLQSKSNVLLQSRVMFLTQLSDHLANQLSFETNSPTLAYNKFFEATMKEHPTVMYRICSVALKQVDYALDDEVFAEGELAMAMYFVRTGTFAYRTSFMLEKKSYFSEAALWTPWYHRGDLACADEIGELIGVVSKEFGNVMRSNPKTWDFALEYAHLMVDWMNSMEKTQLTDVTHIVLEVDFAKRSLRGAESDKSVYSVGDQNTRAAWP